MVKTKSKTKTKTKTKTIKRSHVKKTKNMCVACKGISIDKVIKTNNNIVSSWLKDKNYIQDFIDKTPLKPYKQSSTNMSLTLNLSKDHKGAYVLFFASQPVKSDKNPNTMLMKPSKHAYGDFKNSGVTKVDKNNNVTFHFNCPQCYIDDIGDNNKLPETFYRHIHFCISNKDNTKWTNSLYTKIVICELSYKDTMQHLKNGTSILINALPSEYYAKAHIPNSYNLFKDTIKKMSQKELLQWFEEVLVNYPKLHKLVKQKKLHIYELPIITYCAHDKCSASYDATIELLKKGFVNVMEFKGGMKSYLKHKN